MKETPNALITGISSGLGAGLAEVLLDRGFRVSGVSRRGAGELGERPGLTAAAFDLSDFDAVPGALRDLLAGVDHLDLVVLNAGALCEIADLVDTPLSELRRLMEVNVWANKVVLDALLTSGVEIGQVVAISSGASVNGNRGWNGYSLSKAALNMLIKLYAAERPDIHFCALAPGLVDTAMQDYLGSLDRDDQFPALARLKAARGTSAMQTPAEAAQRIIDALPRLRERTSGGYADLREL